MATGKVIYRSKMHAGLKRDFEGAKQFSQRLHIRSPLDARQGLGRRKRMMDRPVGGLLSRNLRDLGLRRRSLLHL